MKIEQVLGDFEGDINEALFEPRADCGALKLSGQLAAKVDEATSYTAKELDQLIAEIQEIKARTLREADLVKEALAHHFQLTSEALAFREKVSKRLNGLKK